MKDTLALNHSSALKYLIYNQRPHSNKSRWLENETVVCVKWEDRRPADGDAHCGPPDHSPHAEEGLERLLLPFPGQCRVQYPPEGFTQPMGSWEQQPGIRRWESSPVTKRPHMPQHQYTNHACGARWYLLISWSWSELTRGRPKGSFILKQLAKALRQAHLHQSLQVSVCPHQPRFVKHSVLQLPFPRAALLPAVLNAVQCCGCSSSLQPASLHTLGKDTPPSQKCSSVVLSYSFFSPDIWNVSFRGQIGAVPSFYAVCRKEEGRGFTLLQHRWALIIFCIISGQCYCVVHQSPFWSSVKKFLYQHLLYQSKTEVDEH